MTDGSDMTVWWLYKLIQPVIKQIYYSQHQLKNLWAVCQSLLPGSSRFHCYDTKTQPRYQIYINQYKHKKLEKFCIDMQNINPSHIFIFVSKENQQPIYDLLQEINVWAKFQVLGVKGQLLKIFINWNISISLPSDLAKLEDLILRFLLIHQLWSHFLEVQHKHRWKIWEEWSQLGMSHYL